MCWRRGSQRGKSWGSTSVSVARRGQAVVVVWLVALLAYSAWHLSPLEAARPRWSAVWQGGPVNSYPDTTGPGVPGYFRALLRSYGAVDEAAVDQLGAAEATAKLEAACGWDAAGSLKNPNCLPPPTFSREGGTVDTSDVEVVIPTIRNLDFLESWRGVLEGIHLIIIQDGDPEAHLTIPDWADYELYNRRDIEAALGERSWVISSADASIRNFGFLVAKATYIWTLDDDCLPMDTSSNPLFEHLRNLQTNSTPKFFNTLYDPYATGADFVRGFPYSLRQGVPTAISHGLWLHAPDYDAPTQLLKPDERNTRFVNATLTIPSGTLYPMCSMNVAFNRRLIGPAFMQGLMGNGMPWARYDDMFAGWASKVVCDHLNLGVKSGAPYIRHNKASNPFTNLRKEYMGLLWQEEIIRVFQNTRLSTTATTVQGAYRELATVVEVELRHLNPYFGKLAHAMRIWVDVWDEAQRGFLTFLPSRRGRTQQLPAILRPLFVDKRLRPIAAYLDPQHLALKFYIYPLPTKFHADLIQSGEDMFRQGNNCDLSGDLCEEEQWTHPYSIWRQYTTEITIFRKFLSTRLTTTPEDADFFIVPHFYATSHFQNLYHGCCDELLGHLHHYEHYREKHVFLATMDPVWTGDWIKSQPIFFSYGPRYWKGSASGALVVPPVMIEPTFHRNEPMLKKEYLIFLATGLLGTRPFRTEIFQWVSEITTRYPVHKYYVHHLTGVGRDLPDSPQVMWTRMKESTFCIIPPGDTPYQRRFFTAIVSLCIPVVFTWTYPRCIAYWPDEDACRENAYPFWQQIPYTDFLVEIPFPTASPDTIWATLTSFTVPEIEARQQLMLSWRQRLLYDHSGMKKDAFYTILEELANRNK